MTDIRHVYDPVAAHLYYVQNRQLKGRKPGDAPPTSEPHQSQKGPAAKAPMFVTHPPGVVKHPSNAAIQAAADKRVIELKARLEQLRTELKHLVDRAKARSGVKPKTNDTKSKADQAKAGSTKEKPKTASEKDKAAKAAQEYYDKTHPEAALLTQIADVQKKIEKKREDLLESVKTARRKAAVQFVSKRPTG